MVGDFPGCGHNHGDHRNTGRNPDRYPADQLGSAKRSDGYVDRPAAIPLALKRGFEKEVSNKKSVGRETTFSTSIDTLAFHSALIFAACGCAYLCQKSAASLGIPVLKYISVWAYALICMSLIWWIMCRLHLDNLVDESAKGHITGNLTEFAVVGAVASLPIKAVAAYIVPIIVMCILGFATTVLWLYLLSKIAFLNLCMLKTVKAPMKTANPMIMIATLVSAFLAFMCETSFLV